MLRFKKNHSPRPKEITHWANSMRNKTREIKELCSRNEEKKGKKKKRMRGPKSLDPKTHGGTRFKTHETKERPSRPRSVSQEKPNKKN